jgi:hypothetical protein
MSLKEIIKFILFDYVLANEYRMLCLKEVGISKLKHPSRHASRNY